jgi:hypothetical protein
MRALSIGGSGSFQYDLRSLQLRAGLGPSIAVVTMDDEPDRKNASPDTDLMAQTHFDFRMGANLQLLFPLTRLLRGVVSLDGELSPAELLHDGPRPVPPLYPFPTATVGLGLGVEVAIP